MARASLTTGLLILMAASASAQIGWWQCEVTHYFQLPEMWTCSLSKSCCLTGSRLMTTGCCQEMKYESVFLPRSGYIACSPISARKYYCPINRDCCTVARSGGLNETGCCVSQTAVDTPVTGAVPTVGYGVEETEEKSPPKRPKALHRRLSTGTILLIALIPCLAIVISIVTATYYFQAKKLKEQRRLRGVHRAQLQTSALGFHPHGDDGSVAYEASGVAPPSYWETVDESESAPLPAVSLVVPSQSEHHRPPAGNVRYTRLENDE